MKVVAYCRVSTNKEDQKNSLENQKEHYMQLFKEKNMHVADSGLLYKKDGTKEILQGIYADEGLSGAASYKIRGAFIQLIEDAKRGNFDRIYIKNITRFTRNVEDGSKILKDLKEYNVDVYFEDGGLSSLNQANEMVLNMLISVAQEESRLKSSAVQFGIRRAQNAGKWTGGVHPYGYDLIDGYLCINNEESQIVKQIYNMYLNEGSGFQKIARYLNENNIPTKLGKQWSIKQISSMLYNPLYNGVQRTHMSQVTDVNRKTKKEIDESEWIVHNKDELKIIDDDTYQLVKEELKNRSEMFSDRHNRPSNTHLLSNIVVCGNCNTGMSRKKRRAYIRKDGTSKELGYEWACAINDKYGKTRCQYRNAYSEEYLQQLVKDAIEDMKNDPSQMDIVFKQYIKLNYTIDIKEITKLEDDISRLNKKKKMNLELLTDGIIDKEQYQEQNDEIQMELKEKEERVNRAKYIDAEIEEQKRKYKQYLKYLQEVDTNNLTNTVLKKLIRNIIVFTPTDTDEKRIQVNWNFIDTNLIEILNNMIEKLKQMMHKPTTQS